MSNHFFTENEEIAPSAAAVTSNVQDVHILMIGAGRGASALMEVFPRYEWLHLDAIADLNQNAVAFPLAKAQGVACYTDIDQALAGFEGDLVVDVTGDPAMGVRLRTWSVQTDIEVIAGKSAKLLFDMSRHQISDRKTIHMQDAHMFLLDNLLDISTELSNQMPLNSIAGRMLEGISSSTMDIKGLAITFDGKNESTDVVGAVGLKKPVSLPMSLLQELCTSLAPDDHYKILTEPLLIDTHAGEQASFNVVLPFWQDQTLSGILLFAIRGEIEKEQEHMLDTASLHLRIITTTMDQFQKLEQQAATDPLTGVLNRRMFEAKLQQEVTRCQRNKEGHVSCSFIDMDDFKQINDRYGHQAGDEALKHVVACLRHCIRAADSIGRYGGDEFVLLLPADHSEDIEHVHHIGERILKRLSTHPLSTYPDMHISASIGIATQSPSTVDAKTIIKLADEAAYHAKNEKSHGGGHLKCVATM